MVSYRNVTFKDPPGFFILTKLSEPFYMQTYSYCVILFNDIADRLKYIKKFKMVFPFILPFLFLSVSFLINFLQRSDFLLSSSSHYHSLLTLESVYEFCILIYFLYRDSESKYTVLCCKPVD